MRRPIVAGNWKMHRTTAEARRLARAIREQLGDAAGGVEVVLCPPSTALQAVGETLVGSPIALGAQNAHWLTEGAVTGEVSAGMLAELGCRYVIVGHSERRAQLGETDEMVNRKAHAVLAAGMHPIVCVGESLVERERKLTEEVVRMQLERGLDGLGPALAAVVIAYEPVWAIGTGRTASPEQARSVHGFIRSVLAAQAGREVAEAVRIQYGGSIKPENAAELFAQPEIDGGLVGGASLAADSFTRIVRAAA